MAENQEAAGDAAAASEVADENTAAVVSERPPLVIKRGTRIQMGPRRGRIDQVRGDPVYDVRVKWEGEKYPQFLLYQSLKRQYELGNLRCE